MEYTLLFDFLNIFLFILWRTKTFIWAYTMYIYLLNTKDQCIWRVLIFIHCLCKKKQYQKYMIYSSMYMFSYFTTRYVTIFSSKIPCEIKVYVRYSDAEIKDWMLINHCMNTELMKLMWYNNQNKLFVDKGRKSWWNHCSLEQGILVNIQIPAMCTDFS